MHISYGLDRLKITSKHHVVTCRKDYCAPFDSKVPCVFKKGDIYQAEDHDDAYRVWRNPRSFLNFSPSRFDAYFRIFC